MADLNAEFEAAVASAKDLRNRPDNAALLKLYALYKQATSGDNAAAKPGFSDPVARAKWDAWKALQGTDRDDAKKQYITLVGTVGGAAPG